MKDYYKILGVNNSASADEIKSAYRKLAVQHHPDKGGDEEVFKEINEAYDTLKDDTKRQKYDLNLKYGNMSGSYRTNSNPFDDFTDVFSEIFQTRYRPKRNISLRTTINLDQILKPHDVSYSVNGQPFTIRLPAGVTNGATYQQKLFDDTVVYISVHILPHPLFEIDEKDPRNLHTYLDIYFIDCILGTSIELSLLDKSKIKVDVPAFSNEKTILRLKGKGVSNFDIDRGQTTGDCFVHIRPKLPKTLSDDELDLIKKLKG